MTYDEQIEGLEDLIREYRELCRESRDMQYMWEHGSPEEAAMCDPSDQYLKGEEVDSKFKEIKNYFNNLEKD